MEEERNQSVPTSLWSSGLYNSKSKTWNIKPPSGKKLKKLNSVDVSAEAKFKGRYTTSILGGFVPLKSNTVLPEAEFRRTQIETLGPIKVVNSAGLARQSLALPYEAPKRALYQRSSSIDRTISPSLLFSRGLSSGLFSRPDSVSSTLHKVDVTMFGEEQGESKHFNALDMLFQSDPFVNYGKQYDEPKPFFDDGVDLSSTSACSVPSTALGRPYSRTSMNDDSPFLLTSQSLRTVNSESMKTGNEILVSTGTKSNESIHNDEKNKNRRIPPRLNKTAALWRQEEAMPTKQEAYERTMMQRQEWDPVRHAVRKMSLSKGTNSSGVDSWKVIRVFLSSTFDDMHGEREVIHAKVIPDLNTALKKLNIKVVCVDLRFGLVRENHFDHGKGAIMESLMAVESCPAFFISLIGDNYGWQPRNAKVPLNLHSNFEWLKDYRKDVSINVLEAYQGFLKHPFRPAHVFCYNRDNSFLKEIHDDKAKRIFEFSGDSKTFRMKESFRQKVKSHEYSKWRKYKCHYGGIDQFGRPHVNGLLDTFATPLFQDLHAAVLEMFPDLAIASKNSIIGSNSSHFTSMAQSREFTRNEQEEVEVRRFIRHHTKPTVVGLAAVEKMISLLQNSPAEEPENNGRAIALLGKPGVGKTWLLCSLIREHKRLFPDAVLVSYIVGPQSSNEEDMLVDVGKQLLDLFKLTDDDTHTKYAHVAHWFVRVLKVSSDEALSRGMRVVIVVDGLDQLDECLHDKLFEWIPQERLKGCSILLSCASHDLDGVPNAAAAKLLVNKSSLTIEHVKTFSKVEAKQLLELSMGNFSECNDRHIKTLLSKEHSQNPLYQYVMTTEIFAALQSNGDWDTIINGIISRSMPGTLCSVQMYALARMERDMEYDCSLWRAPPGCEVSGFTAIEKALCLLACSRRGLQEEIMQKLMHPLWRSGYKFQDSLWLRLKHTIAAYIFPNESMENRHLKFQNREIFKAVKLRYFSNTENVNSIHKSLADHIVLKYMRMSHGIKSVNWMRECGKRPGECISDLLDIAYHQLHAIDLLGLKQSMGNMDYIQSCFYAAVMTRNKDIICSLLQYYRTGYAILCRAKPSVLKRALKSVNSSKLELKWWFEGMWYFLVKKEKLILRAPHLTLQLALNDEPNTPAQLLAESTLLQKNDLSNWNWVRQQNLPSAYLQSSFKTRKSYTAFTMIKNDSLLALGKEDGSISIMDYITGNVKVEFSSNSSSSEAEGMSISDMEASFDGRLLLTKSYDGRMYIWDLECHEYSVEFPGLSKMLGIFLPTHQKNKLEYILVTVDENEDLSTWTFQTDLRAREPEVKCGLTLKQTVKRADTHSLCLYNYPQYSDTCFYLGTVDDGIHMWEINISDFTPRFLRKVASGAILCCAMNPLYDIVATGDLEGNLTLWSTVEATNVDRSESSTAILQAVANRLGIGSNTSNGALFATLNEGGNIVYLEWYSVEGKSQMLVSACQNGMLNVWKFGCEENTLIKLADLDRTISDGLYWRFAIDKNVVVGAHGTHGLSIWDLNHFYKMSISGVCAKHHELVIPLDTIHKSKIVSSAISSNGIFSATLDQAGNICIWHMAVEELRHGAVCQTILCESANILCFSDNSSHLLVGTKIGKILIWELHKEFIFRGELGDIGTTTLTSVAFSPDLRLAALGCANGKIHIFDVEMKKSVNVKQQILTTLLSNGDAHAATTALKHAWQHPTDIIDVKFFDINFEALGSYTLEPNDNCASEHADLGNLEKYEVRAIRKTGSQGMENQIAKRVVSLSSCGLVKVWSLDTFECLILYQSIPPVHRRTMLCVSDEALFTASVSLKSSGVSNADSIIFEKIGSFEGIFHSKVLCPLEEPAQENMLTGIPKDMFNHNFFLDFQLSRSSMSGLKKQANAVCFSVGFCGLYLAVGFDDGTLQLYDTKIGHLLGAFVCDSCIETISMPMSDITGNFICTDRGGGVYILTVVLPNFLRRQLNSSIVSGTGSLLNRRSNTRYFACSLESNPDARLVSYSTSARSKDTLLLNKVNSSDKSPPYILARMNLNWSPTRKSLQKFWRQMEFDLVPFGTTDSTDATRLKTKKDRFILISDRMFGMAHSLNSYLWRIIENGILEAATSGIVITNGVDQRLNKIIATKIEEMNYATRPSVLAVVASEGVVLPTDIQSTISLEGWVQKFSITSNIETKHRRIVAVQGCRKWSSRLNVLQQILQSMFDFEACGVGVLINGNYENLQEMEIMMNLDAPILLVEGSGGIADLIAGHRKHQKPQKKFGWSRLKGNVNPNQAWLMTMEERSSSRLKKDVLIRKFVSYSKLHVFHITDPPEKIKSEILRLCMPVKKKFKSAVRRVSTLLQLGVLEKKLPPTNTRDRLSLELEK